MKKTLFSFMYKKLITFRLYSIRVIISLYNNTMGKNKCGGNKQKAMENSQAQKHVQYSMHPDEVYVVVTKSLGNSTFQVADHQGKKYIAHVRGKMKGASKRKFFIHTNDILLVELRAYEKNTNTCDVICIYNDSHHPNIKTYPLLIGLASTSETSTPGFGISVPQTSLPEIDIDIDILLI